MLKWLIRNRLAAFERAHAYDASYMREILAADTRAFLKFARVAGIGSYRRDVPLDVYYGAKLTAVIAEDCGPCTQLVVGLALADRADPKTIATIVAGDETKLGEEARLGVEFARAVLARDPAADELRDEIVRRWGPRAVISLGFGIVSARIYPTLKYALGHGKACARVVVAGETIVPRHAA